MHRPHAQKAPADGLALLRWTLHAVDRYFTTLGTRRLWLMRDKAVTCVRSCQQFTETWQHASQVLSGALCASASVHAYI